MDIIRLEVCKMLAQAMGILEVTGGSENPSARPVQGFAGTIRSEFRKEPFLVLAVEGSKPYGTSFARAIASVIKRSLFKRPGAKEEFDREFLLRDGVIHIPRVVQNESLDEDLARETKPGIRSLQPFPQEARPLRLVVPSPGLLDSLSFVDDERVLWDLQTTR